MVKLLNKIMLNLVKIEGRHERICVGCQICHLKVLKLAINGMLKGIQGVVRIMIGYTVV